MQGQLDTVPLKLLVLSFTFLNACSNEAPANAASDKLDQSNGRLKYMETPQYGPRTTIRGATFFGQETSIVSLCDGQRDQCETQKNVDGSEQPCWLDFTEDASTAITKLAGLQRIEDGGAYWMEGEGRLALQPGSFGHLSQYTCQVEMSGVRVFEEGPPYIYAPPPMPTDASSR